MATDEMPTDATNGSLRRNDNAMGILIQRLGDATSPPHHTVVDVSGEVQPIYLQSKPLPFILSFTNLTYSVKSRRKLFRNRGGDAEMLGSGPRTLLDSVTGEAREGEVLAVLGASGSGKTTLIDALANRIAKGSLGGSVRLNGETLESRLLKVISAYVMQDDLLYPMLTVEETLMFSAQFRLPQSLSHSKKKERVRNLMEQLGLRHAAKTIIGDETHRGVSGGERRRVSIGIDIIHDPIILFLDEPTSGLDSTSAFMVVKVLKRIAISGSIVVMSIHQPSSRVVSLLDKLLFLSRGRVVYSGTPAGLHPFFADFGQPIPENENRTEFALDQIRELENSPAGTDRLVGFYNTWQKQRLELADSHDGPPEVVPLREAISASISRGKLVSGATSDGAVPTGNIVAGSAEVRTFANPVWVEIGVLMKRSFTNGRRFPERFAVRLVAVLLTGFILATIFWRLDTSSKGVQERLGLLAFTMSTTFYTCADALPVFLQDRYIFMRETAYNAYRRSSYVLANIILSLPALVLLAATFSATTFFAVGLAGGLPGFAFYFLTILSAFWAGSSFVTFLSGVISHVMIGFTIVVAILAYFLLLSGFFITRQRIPSYWIWFHYLSLVKYPYEAVLHNEFDDPSRCFVRGMQMFDGTPLVGASTATKEALMQGMSSVLGMNITASTCLVRGPDILRQQGITQLGKWDCIWTTLAWGFLFRGLFYVALLLGSKNKRK